MYACTKKEICIYACLIVYKRVCMCISAWLNEGTVPMFLDLTLDVWMAAKELIRVRECAQVCVHVSILLRM